MTSRVHLMGIPEREELPARVVGRTHFLYTQHVNGLHGRLGHFWQNRFYSPPMDGTHAPAAVR